METNTPEKILYKGLRIKLWRLSDAGGYSIIRVSMFSEKLIKEMSGGEPFECAYQEAEELAILVDAELVLSNSILRKAVTGEYK